MDIVMSGSEFEIYDSQIAEHVLEKLSRAMASGRWPSIRKASSEIGIEYTSFTRIVAGRRPLSVRNAIRIAISLNLSDEEVAEIVRSGMKNRLVSMASNHILSLELPDSILGLIGRPKVEFDETSSLENL